VLDIAGSSFAKSDMEDRLAWLRKAFGGTKAQN
jgi:hypothetical protein